MHKSSCYVCFNKFSGKREAQAVPIQLSASREWQWVPKSSSKAHKFGLDPVTVSKSVSLHLMRLITTHYYNFTTHNKISENTQLVFTQLSEH